MIVSESDVLVAALDRRLAVDGVLALGPLAAVADDAGAPRADAAQASAGPMRSGVTSDRLELGALVTARVVDVRAGGRLVVDLGRLLFAIDWPEEAGTVPATGRDIMLRTLATTPQPVFAIVDPSSNTTRVDADPRLSAAALALQGGGADNTALLRFTTPILSTGPAPPTSAEPPVGDPADAAIERAALPAFVLPLVLQGPAWPGQGLELVVHRERADEAFDNAALDQWCGELVVDLPRLGRVSAHVAWSMQGLKLRLGADVSDSTSALAAASGELAAALTAADLPVLALTVARG